MPKMSIEEVLAGVIKNDIPDIFDAKPELVYVKGYTGLNTKPDELILTKLESKKKLPIGYVFKYKHDIYVITGTEPTNRILINVYTLKQLKSVDDLPFGGIK